MSLSAHQTTAPTRDEWLTPPEFIDALGPFDLDPAAPIVRPWPTAKTHCTVDDDGLSQVWFGRVWLNPPFNRDIWRWIERLANHGNGILLVAARTETAHWHEYIWPRASGVLFLRGRPHFYHTDGRRAKYNSGAPIALAAYGDECRVRLFGSVLQGARVKVSP